MVNFMQVSQGSQASPASVMLWDHDCILTDDDARASERVPAEVEESDGCETRSQWRRSTWETGGLSLARTSSPLMEDVALSMMPWGHDRPVIPTQLFSTVAETRRVKDRIQLGCPKSRKSVSEGLTTGNAGGEN